jgi:hypothetical protein
VPRRSGQLRRCRTGGIVIGAVGKRRKLHRLAISAGG